MHTTQTIDGQHIKFKDRIWHSVGTKACIPLYNKWVIINKT